MDLHNGTELKERILWYDGDSTVTEDKIIQLMSSGLPVDGLFVDELSRNIDQYNKLVSDSEKITVKNKVGELNLNWNIPEEYRKLDVHQYIVDTLWEEIQHHQEWIGDQFQQPAIDRALRVTHELKIYTEMQLLDVLRTLIYIINTLQANEVVWGVGRGSSVSSYVLFLIGVHDVDSVKYGLDVEDFLRNE